MDDYYLSAAAEESTSILLQGETFDDKLDSIASLLYSRKNIIALVGAGISVSAGIPDFRSATGLYNTLDHQELGLASPEDLFDIETFRDDPRPFFKFARSLHPGSVEPTPSHYFLADLHRRKTLLRVYTQNIDSLERLSGVGPGRVVHAHGSLSSATCTRCRATYSSGDIASDVGSGNVPTCRRPRDNKKAKKRRRSSAVVGNPTMAKEEELPTTTGAATATATAAAKHSMRLRVSSSAKKSTKSDDGGSYDPLMEEGLCCGVIKPDVTFFGEKLSDEVGRSLREDSKLADALLVMGTSLSVAPMSKVVEFLRPDIPRILINRNIVRVPKVSHKDEYRLFHACLLGDCVGALARRMKGCDGGKVSKTGVDRGDADGGLATGDETTTWSHNQPKESILLFRGAVVSNSDEAHIGHAMVVHCDACRREIIEGRVYCCKTCFDYDLCGACYPSSSLMHADGKHEFAVER